MFVGLFGGKYVNDDVVLCHLIGVGDDVGL